jgi:hypothetical protein
MRHTTISQNMVRMIYTFYRVAPSVVQFIPLKNRKSPEPPAAQPDARAPRGLVNRMAEIR